MDHDSRRDPHSHTTPYPSNPLHSQSQSHHDPHHTHDYLKYDQSHEKPFFPIYMVHTEWDTKTIHDHLNNHITTGADSKIGLFHYDYWKGQRVSRLIYIFDIEIYENLVQAGYYHNNDQGFVVRPFRLRDYSFPNADESKNLYIPLPSFLEKESCHDQIDKILKISKDFGIIPSKSYKIEIPTSSYRNQNQDQDKDKDKHTNRCYVMFRQEISMESIAMLKIIFHNSLWESKEEIEEKDLLIKCYWYQKKYKKYSNDQSTYPQLRTQSKSQPQPQARKEYHRNIVEKSIPVQQKTTSRKITGTVWDKDLAVVKSSGSPPLSAKIPSSSPTSPSPTHSPSTSPSSIHPSIHPSIRPSSKTILLTSIPSIPLKTSNPKSLIPIKPREKVDTDTSTKDNINVDVPKIKSNSEVVIEIPSIISPITGDNVQGNVQGILGGTENYYHRYGRFPIPKVLTRPIHFRPNMNREGFCYAEHSDLNIDFPIATHPPDPRGLPTTLVGIGVNYL